MARGGLMRNPERAVASFVTFRLREAFPVNDPLSVPLLRFMAATNDARHMVRLLTTLHDGIEMLNDTEKLLRTRSEEHTSELQSRLHLVCRLLLEKKKKTIMLGEKRRLRLVRYNTR